jgi:hypothetical protein
MKTLLALLLLLMPVSAFAEEKSLLEQASDFAAKAILGYKADREYRDQPVPVRRQSFVPQRTPDHIRFQTDQKLAIKADR